MEVDRPLEPGEKARLNTASGSLFGHILKHGQHILGSEADHAELIRRQILSTKDFQPYINRMPTERRKAWTCGMPPRVVGLALVER